FRSDVPLLAGPITTRVIGGLLLSQAANAFQNFNPDLAPHTMYYKFIAKTNIPLKLEVKHFDSANMASIRVSQKDKIIGIVHFR
ncbi:hypothetical protein PMAYCL1PPCAC_05791, partial [Pristionchus mayeri]